MSIPSRLSGGTLYTRDPSRKAGPYTEPAFMRLFGPTDLYLSTGCMHLFRDASFLLLGSPDTQWAEVSVREMNGVKYILVVPTDDKNPRKVPISRPHDNSGLIRTADDVLLAGGVAMVPGFVYKMDAALVEDEDLGWAVASSWTHAQQEAKK